MSGFERLHKNPAAIVFDLDGTLLDTEPLYSLASQKVLDVFGHIYTAELKRRVMGGDSHTSAQVVIDEFGLPLSSTEYLQLRESHLLEFFRNCPEIEGAGDFVIAANNSNLSIGLATSSHRYLRDIKLAGKPWASLFMATVCGDSPALKRGKPAPDIFLLCAEALQVPPDRCIAFEDSRNGIASAKAAGMQVVAVNSPFVDLSDLSEATVIMDSYAAAADWLRSISARG